ncbi:pseudouridine-metabolizing bifunctional -like isoform X1, partial [Paramuricea clavata]
MLRRWSCDGGRYLNFVAKYSSNSWKSKTVVHKEVSEALLKNKPVVALESTIITHGMPFPQNLKTARSVIEIIRRNGVVPATVAVLNGELHIGLTRSELEYISKMGKSAIKTSRRDIPAVLSKGLVGGTTVSGTMVAAAVAGIPIFVTGGIGGVHYGADKTFDVSADLTELGRTPVTVVCAGVKSILDIGLTLEYLETHGVTVATFGDSLDFPAFFTPNSGFKVPYNVKTPEEAASMIECNIEMGLKSGMLIGVPIPESHAPLGTQIEAAIQQALQDAKNKGVSGKEVTPFVLQRVNQLTKGKSLEANIALIQNNALVGSQIALELNKLREIKAYGKPQTVPNISEDHTPKTAKQPVVIGGSNIDFTAKANSEIMFYGATNVGRVRQTFGGVGRNIAECIARIGHCKPLLISAVGGDDLGEMLLRQLELVRVSTYGVHISKDSNTATYSVVLNNQGEVVLGIGDMEAHGEVTAQL